MLLRTSDYKNFQLENDITFSDFKQANHCLPGDTVEWKENLCHLMKRGIHRFLPGVLELNSKYIYGHTSRGNKIYLFHPHDKKYPPFRVGSTLRSLTANQLALIEFMDWDAHESMPRGNLLQILGPCGEQKAEFEALSYQYSSPKVAKQAFPIHEAESANRKRIEGFTFNIDPEGCKDIDDVFTLHQKSETKWDFLITISDVSVYILEGSEGDKHAYTLGETLYQDSQAIVPMLPFALSEKALSLHAGEEHLGVTLYCSWDTQTKQLDVGSFEETVFRNDKSFTYDSIYKTKDFPLQILQEIASFLHGTPTSDSHEWVAECMILYNKEVAKILLQHKVGLLRSHKPANAERLKLFTEIHPDLHFLAYEAAKYQPTGQTVIHAGLGSVGYSHSTSPIRRYADLLNQRHLKAILQRKPLPSTDSSVAEHLNQIQKQMRHYNRCAVFLKHVVNQPTGFIEGLVVVTTDTKTKVFVPSWKLMIRLDPIDVMIGQKISIEYYADLQKPHWDKRMVFRVSKTSDSIASQNE